MTSPSTTEGRAMVQGALLWSPHGEGTHPPQGRADTFLVTRALAATPVWPPGLQPPGPPTYRSAGSSPLGAAPGPHSRARAPPSLLRIPSPRGLSSSSRNISPAVRHPRPQARGWTARGVEVDPASNPLSQAYPQGGVTGRRGLWETARVRRGHERGARDGIRVLLRRERDRSSPLLPK